jgi:HK97 family phage prohead protease
MNFERRSFAEPVEFRAQGTSLVASGVAMRYGAKSKPIAGKFREVFRSGAFAKTIQEQDVRAHHEHGGPYLARTGAGTLRLHDDRDALAYEIDLPDTTAGRDAAALLERGDLGGSSIGFRAMPSRVEWSRDGDGLALRTVGEARLFVVDLVTEPAYGDSTAELALRSLAEATGTDLTTVLEAADAGRLADMIDPPVPVETDGGEGDETATELADIDGRETPTVARARIAWLYH